MPMLRAMAQKRQYDLARTLLY